MCTIITGLIALDVMHSVDTKTNLIDKSGQHFPGENVHILQTETEVFQKLVDVVKVEDPDILVGFETQRSSWGFLCRRASSLHIDLPTQLSRIPCSPFESKFSGPQG